MDNSRRLSLLFIALKIVFSAAVIALDVFVLIRYEYWNNLLAVDNFLGTIPLSLILIFSVAAFFIIWWKTKKEKIYLPIIAAGWMVVCVVLFPNALANNWFFGQEVVSMGSDGDITPYRPFEPGTKAVTLDEPSSLTLTENLPIMDGALALYPVYSAVAQTVYDVSAYTDEVRFTNTIRGFNALVDGDVDIFFSAYPSASQLDSAKQKGVELNFTPIGKEAFVFLVPKSNPIDGLTTQQIRNIYSGKTSNWRTLGWNEGGQMLKFQRPEGSGSQSYLQAIMKDLPIEAPQPAPNLDIIGTNSLMKQMTVEYNGVQPALGYTYRFFALTMNPNPDTKFLSINGIAPTPSTIADSTYPYVAKFYAITRANPEGNVKKVLDWLQGEQGQTLIEKSGYSRLS